MLEKTTVITYNQAVKRLVGAVQELSLARDMETVMKIVRTVAREITGADGATFVLKAEDTCFYADEDAIMPLWKGNRFPITDCISGWTMLNCKAVAIVDIYQDSRIPIDAYKSTFVKSLVMVPIRTSDPIGAIGNYWAHEHKATEDEIELLQSLADVTAVTIENVKVYNCLEQKVKERTMELEEANKGLEAFSYSVSHDLHAPLRSIMGFSQILKEDNICNLNDEGKKVLDSIQANASRMNVLIDDLLEFAKLGKSALKKTNVDMRSIIQQLIIEFTSTTSNKIDFNINSDILPAHGDYSLLKQVWYNLISNAVKYSSKKENPTIGIGSYKDNTEIIYYIKDNGAGFSMEYANKLFGVFQRLHSTSEFEGTGIGLAIVQRIIVRHGGKVWAEGKVEEGAIFHFSLPEFKVTEITILETKASKC